jgi:hypothetical protein
MHKVSAIGPIPAAFFLLPFISFSPAHAAGVVIRLSYASVVPPGFKTLHELHENWAREIENGSNSRAKITYYLRTGQVRAAPGKKCQRVFWPR